MSIPKKGRKISHNSHATSDANSEKCHCRFAHLVESVDVGNLEAEEVQQRLSDHIVELERETGNCVRLHSIP